MLQQCLYSFQQFPPQISYEIIVIDNDSRDGKFDIFAKHNPQIKLIKNSSNKGFSNGCNLGADNSHGEFLLFLNPDTELTNNAAIDDMFNFAQQNLDIGITSCRKINPKGKPEREITFANPWLIISWIRYIYKLINKAKIQKKFPESGMIWNPDWVAGSVVVIEKKLFNKIGKWNQNDFWMYYEDVDLCRKVKSQNKEIALLRNVELKHSHGGSSRKSPKSIAITKSEVITSGHVYIQTYKTGFFCILTHITIALIVITSQLLRVLITLPLFWKMVFQSNILVLLVTIKYYFYVPMRGTWKSKRLKL